MISGSCTERIYYWRPLAKSRNTLEGGLFAMPLVLVGDFGCLELCPSSQSLTLSAPLCTLPNYILITFSNLCLRRCLVGPDDNHHCGLWSLSKVFSGKTYWRWKRLRSDRVNFYIEMKGSVPCQESSSWLFLFREGLKFKSKQIINLINFQTNKNKVL